MKTSPFLWFNDNAEEAIAFYTSIFKASQITNLVHDDHHSQAQDGTLVAGSFELAGREFLAANGGQPFSFTPAISFFVNCRTEQEMDEAWKKLSEGGRVMMELGQYPFSPKFGWLADRFGLSWQLHLARSEQRIAPFLLFAGKQHGRAEEALDFYVSLFPNSRVIRMDRFGPGEQEQEGTVKRAIFSLCGEEFMMMETGQAHRFTFNSAVSFYVSCETQAQVDRLWERLSARGEQQRAGWLKDRYGVSWLIVPAIVRSIVESGDQQKAMQVLRAMTQMTRPDIRRLEEAYRK